MGRAVICDCCKRGNPTLDWSKDPNVTTQVHLSILRNCHLGEDGVEFYDLYFCPECAEKVQALLEEMGIEFNSLRD